MHRHKGNQCNVSDFKIQEAFNYDKSVFFAEHNTNGKKYLVKVIDLGASNGEMESAKVHRLQSATYSQLLKPELFCTKKEDNKNTYLYLFSARMPISLQRILTIYRSKGAYLSRRFIEHFIQPIYNLIYKLNEQGMSHGNIKPSNIFFKDKAWVVGECGLPSTRINKNYVKGYDHKFDKLQSLRYSAVATSNINIEGDLFSMGIVALQMLSIENVSTIRRMIGNPSQKYKLRELYDKCSKNYGSEMVEFIKSLIENPNMSKELYKRFKSSCQTGDSTQNEQISIESYNNTEYSLNLPELHEFIDRIKQQNEGCTRTIENFEAVDPQLDFQLAYLPDLKTVLYNSYGLQYQQQKILDLFEYFTVFGQMRYINVVREAYTLEQVIRTILVIVSKKYEKPRQFFEAHSRGAQFWNTNTLKSFLDLGEIDVTTEELRKIIKMWNKDQKRQYLTLKEFVKLLGHEPMDQSRLSASHDRVDKPDSRVVSQSKKLITYDNQLEQMLIMLKDRVAQKSLFRFFQDRSLKMKWVTDHTIEKHITDKIRMPQERLNKAFQMMWSMAGIPGTTPSERKLKYLVLLKDSKMEKPEDLLKMVLTEKVNQTNFSHFFQKYALDKDGWTIESLRKLNDDQLLQFHDRDLNNFMRLLDKDGSQTISEKQLKQKLTGIKEYSESIYVQNLKDRWKETKVPTANLFFNEDRNKDLQFDSLQQLTSVFEKANIPISKEHCQQLYYDYCKRDKFEYIEFLKKVYSDQMPLLFKETLVFVMMAQYENDFEAVYKLGLNGRQTKWQSKSLISVNSQMVLGFTVSQLDEIWKKYDPNDNGSLSKMEIARLFDIKYAKDIYEEEEVPSPERKEEKKQSKLDKRFSIEEKKEKVKEVKKELTFKERLIEQIEKNDILSELAKKGKKKRLIDYFFQADREDRFSVSLRQFEDCLNNLNIEYKKGSVMMYTKDFQFTTSEKELRINFIKLLLLLDALEEEEAQAKSETLISLLKRFMKVRKCTVDDLLAVGKNKKKWSLNAFQIFLLKSLDSEIFFDDIEIVWNYWNCGVELDREELKEILEKGTVKRRKDDEKDLKERKESSRRNEDESRRDSRRETKINTFRDEGNSHNDRRTEAKGSYRDSKEPIKKDSRRSPQRTYENATREQDTWNINKRYSRPESPRNEDDYDRQRKMTSKFNQVEDDEIIRKNSKLTHNRRDSQPRYEGVQRPKRNESTRNRKQSGHSDNEPSFAIKKGEDVSFMQRPVDDRRRNYDEDQVKYTTDKSQEIQQEPRRISKRKYNAQEMDRQLMKDSDNDQKRRNSNVERVQDNILQKTLKKADLVELQRLARKGEIDKIDLEDYLINECKMSKREAREAIKSISTPKVSLLWLRQLISKPKSTREMERTPRPLSSIKESSQLLSSSQNIPTKKQKINGPLVREHIRAIMSQFCKKYDISELNSFFFGREEAIDTKRFEDRCEEINQQISKDLLRQIFNYMNPVKGQITLLSFKNAFNTSVAERHENLQFPSELQKQLKEVFQRADKDKSQTISKEELPNLLGCFGVNMTAKEAEAYLRSIDTNNSDTIDYEEFKHFLADSVFPVVTNFEEIVDEVRQELQLADLLSTGALDVQQLKGALAKLGGSTINEAELLNLMNQFGRDGKINIKQLLRAVADVSHNKYRNDIRMTLYKIRFVKRLSIKDIKSTFSKLSSCYSLAYSFQTMRSMSLLPSSALRPKLDQSCLYFSDYFYTNINEIEQNKPCLERIDRYNQLVLEVRLDEATGIPIPLETVIPRSNILRRHVTIGFLDNSQEKMRDSMCELQATWDPDLQDVWKFKSQEFDRGIFIKVGDYEDSKFTHLSVLFEFVMTVLDGSSIIEVNCGSASLALSDVSRITSVVSKKLQVSGGIPIKKKFFKKDDILARRSGWRKLIGGGQAQSVMNIEILPQSKFRDKLPLLDVMPLRIILNKSCLSLFRYFREYFAFKSVYRGKINIHFKNDYKIKAFLAALDCRQIYHYMVPFWNDNIDGKIRGISEGREYFQVLCRQLYLIISNRNFQYLPSCPTYDTIGNKTKDSARAKIIQDAFQNFLAYVKKSPQTKKRVIDGTVDPFRVHEVEQDIEDNIMASLKRRAK